jgi:hypothetical protein
LGIILSIYEYPNFYKVENGGKWKFESYPFEEKVAVAKNLGVDRLERNKWAQIFYLGATQVIDMIEMSSISHLLLSINQDVSPIKRRGKCRNGLL